MRSQVAAALLMVAVPFAASAGEIYGTVTPQASNLEVQVVCGDQKQNAFLDPRGFYRFYISRQGECKVSVRRGSGDWSEPFPIFSSERPVRYDLLLKGNQLSRQ